MLVLLNIDSGKAHEPDSHKRGKNERNAQSF